jgi:hypothetical protein
MAEWIVALESDRVTGLRREQTAPLRDNTEA